MDETIVKEDLSICYISAVAANAGIAYDRQQHDADSTDGILKGWIDLPDGKKYHSEIRVQLKSTSSESQYEENDTEIKYVLKVKNYNELCRRGTAPIILCLLVLPSERENWLHWSREELLLRGCMYWASFAGKEASSNTANITVVFDKEKVVNSDTLQELLEKVAREEVL